MNDFMSPFGAFNPGTRMFSIFFKPADLLGTLVLADFFRGFFFGSGCLTVSGANPASLRLLRGGAAAFLGADFFLDAGFLAFFLPHRHSARARPA